MSLPMLKFVGFWEFGGHEGAAPPAMGSEAVLSIRFNRDPGEKTAAGVTEYLSGYALPKPSDEELVDPLRHHGAYEWIHYDPSKRRMRCGTDFFGIGRLYYSTVSGGLMFSNDLFALAKQARLTTISKLGGAMVLALNECMGRHTPIEGISRLEHGEVLELNDRELSITREWRLRPPDASTETSRFIADNNEIFLENMRHTSPWAGSRVCPMTGGDDSRRIAAGLSAVGLEADFISQRAIEVGGYDEDTIPAQMVADHLEKPLKIVAVPSVDEVKEDGRATLIQTNGESLIIHYWLLKTLRHAPAASLLYDGLGGGELMNGHYVKAFPECAEHYHRPQRIAEAIMATAQIRLHGSLEDMLADELLAYIDKIPETPYRMTLYYLYNHTRRNTGSMAAMMREEGFTPYMPFVERTMAEQCLSLDYREHLGELYQGLATKALDSKLDTIPRTRLGFSKQYKVDLNDLVEEANKAEVSVGQTDLSMTARFCRLDETLKMVHSEMFSVHHKHGWRSSRLRLLGLIRAIAAGQVDLQDRAESAFSVERVHRAEAR